MKDKAVHGLLKLPDEALIKELRIELGKQASYIQELEDEIKFLKKEETEEKKKIRREKLFDEYRGQIKNLNDKIRKLKKDNEYLIIKLNSKV
ncbi:hypothetical protein LJC39_04070 [Parabacteroides sp. OttesenSCG-928-B22]|nr:hypothetical protein [Parabacteroides sp. OttesenSCG-928-B22]